MLRKRIQEQEEKACKLLQSYQTSCEKRKVSPELPLEEFWMGEEAFIHLEQQIRQYRERVPSGRRTAFRAAKEITWEKSPRHAGDTTGFDDFAPAKPGESSQQAGALSQSWERLSSTLQVLQREEEKSAVLERQWAQNARVAQLLSGNNKRKIPIKMFVLGIMLDDILSRANLYFSTFSEGRYRLVRPEEEAAGRGYGGWNWWYWTAIPEGHGRWKPFPEANCF